MKHSCEKRLVPNGHDASGNFPEIIYSLGRGSSVSIVSGYGLDDRAMRFDPRQEQRIFPLASLPRPALGPTQAPVQWVPGVLSPGVKRGLGVTLTTHPI
jgi:hypothetical protein